MKVLILAGGLGTRLRSLVSDRPKPMAEVKGRPFLEYQIEQLRTQGFSEFVLCIGHLAHQIEGYFGNGRRWDVSISYAIESEPLGTAGAIRNAQPWIEDAFLVVNGDSYLEADFQALVAYHQHQRATDSRTVGTLLAVAVDNADAYGTLKLDANGRVLRFREKVDGGSGWINGGTYVLEPQILDLVPGGRAVSIEKDVFPTALQKGWHLYGYPIAVFFVDIGTPQGYRRFLRYVEEKRL